MNSGQTSNEVQVQTHTSNGSPKSHNISKTMIGGGTKERQHIAGKFQQMQNSKESGGNAGIPPILIHNA